MIRSAIISADGRYRYRLHRQWSPGDRTLAWLMLNPSTADAVTDDPTIRRVVRFSRDWGYDACDVVNLFAFRSTDAEALVSVDDPVGPRNVRHVRAAIEESAASGVDRIVIAWGRHGARLLDARLAGTRARRVVAAASDQWVAGGMTPVRLGATGGGAPRHPLYVTAATRPEPMPTPSAILGGVRPGNRAVRRPER